MRIEILVNNDEPRVYPLDRAKILLGSHESCDIVIPNKGISRKHVVLIVKDDKYYVVDQGSTNGSYINEHRLVPGSSTEFTSFFPVRLGDDVLMTLLSDEEAQDLGSDSDFNTQKNQASDDMNESTKVISLKDLNKSTTSNLVQKRADTVVRRKTVKKALPPKKQKSAASNTSMIIIAIILISGAGYYELVLNKKEAVVEQNSENHQVVAQAPVVDNRPILRVEENLIPTVEKIMAAYKGPKCTSEIEKYLCVTLPQIYQEKWGTIQIENSTVILADGGRYSQAAKQYIKEPPPAVEAGGTREAMRAYQADLSLMMTVLWVNENVPPELKDLNGMKNNPITVAFIDLSKEEAQFINAVSFVPDSLLRLKHKIQDKDFVGAKKTGPAEFFYALDYLRFL